MAQCFELVPVRGATPQPPKSCHISLKLYKCDKCSFKSELLVLLLHHRKQSHATAPTKPTPCKFLRRVCGRCTFSTYSEIIWLKHQTNSWPREKLGTSNGFQLAWFPCPECPFEALSETMLEKHAADAHKLSHQAPTYYPCGQCSFKSQSKYYLETHERVQHKPVEKQEWLECPHCDFRTLGKIKFEEHVLNKQKSDKAFKFKCDRCCYKGKRKPQLEYHYLAHHAPAGDVEWFKCEQCAFKTKRKTLLNKHVKVKHLPVGDADWWRCPYCAYKAKGKSSWRQHLDIEHVDSVR